MCKLIRITTVPISLDYLLKGQLKFLNQHFEVVAVSGEDEHLLEVAEREQVRTIPLTIQRAIRPFYDLVALWKLYRLFKKERPQIVHSITPKAGLLSMLAAKMAGVPIRMHTFTGLIFPARTGVMQRLLIKMDQLLCWAATHIYPEGNGVKNDLFHYGITSKPLQVLAKGNVNGIDLDYFSQSQVTNAQKELVQQQSGIAPNDFVFIFVGRLVGDKGINELVEAFEGLGIREQGLGTREQGLGTREQGLGTRDEGLDESLELAITSEVSLLPDFSCSFSRIKLLLVGPFESELDPLRSETLNAIATNPNIISVGFQADVRSYFAISDCLVFPSYREGFPNVVLQAGAMGLPSIVTNINGCNEIIEEGINGLIIPPKEIMALQNAMISLLEDKNVYKNLKNNARQMITSRYEQKLVWEALLEEYRRLLEGIRD